MSDTDLSLRDLFRSSSQTEGRALRWSGSFAEYLDLAEANPAVARNAWQRLLDMIELHGYESALDAASAAGKSSRAQSTRSGASAQRRWKLFDDPLGGGRDGVFGLDQPLAEFVQIVRAGARGLGPERRVILLHGPVGSSKSTIVRLIKRGLEDYSRRDEGAIYTFEWNIDGEVTASPMNQDPLLLIPAEERRGFEQVLNRKWRREYSLAVEGELDPVSRFFYKQLLERYEGDWAKVLEHVTVRRFVLSETERVGIGTFQPKDEKNQDSTELTGDVNYRRIAEYGSDSDPRAFNFDGEFNVANRGLLEFIEVLKLDVAFLYDLLGATQEHSIKPKKFAQTHIDEVIIGHTNEPEYKKLQNNELMEAFRDRTIKIDVPYNLAVRDEVKIYERNFGPEKLAGCTVAPHTMEIAALWAVMTRLDDPTHPNLTMLQKAHLYDGREVQGFTVDNMREQRANSEREGLFGISPRYVLDRVATTLVANRDCVGPQDVLAELESGLVHHSLISNEDTRKTYMHLVEVAREEYEEIIKREVQEAISADKEQLDRLCAKYIDNVRAHTTRERVVIDGQSSDPDERLMRSIEEKIDVPEARKDDFRMELLNYIAEVHRQGRTFQYSENKRLTRALELKMFEDRRDTIQLTSVMSTVVDPDAQEKIAVLRTRLMRLFGYDEVSADAVLRMVGGLFARGEAKEQQDDSQEAAA